MLDLERINRLEMEYSILIRNGLLNGRYHLNNIDIFRHLGTFKLWCKMKILDKHYKSN